MKTRNSTLILLAGMALSLCGCGEGFQLQNRWATSHMYVEFLPRHEIVVASRYTGVSRGTYHIDTTSDPQVLTYSVYRENGDNVWAQCDLSPLGQRFLQMEMKQVFVNGEPSPLPRKTRLLLERSERSELLSAERGATPPAA